MQGGRNLIKRLVARIARPLTDDRGAVLVYVTVGLGVFIGVAALAIDGSRLFTLQTEFQSAADAYALAGAARQLDQCDPERRSPDEECGETAGHPLLGPDHCKIADRHHQHAGEHDLGDDAPASREGIAVQLRQNKENNAAEKKTGAGEKERRHRRHRDADCQIRRPPDDADDGKRGVRESARMLHGSPNVMPPIFSQ